MQNSTQKPTTAYRTVNKVSTILFASKHDINYSEIHFETWKGWYSYKRKWTILFKTSYKNLQYENK